MRRLDSRTGDAGSPSSVHPEDLSIREPLPMPVAHDTSKPCRREASKLGHRLPLLVAPGLIGQEGFGAIDGRV